MTAPAVVAALELAQEEEPTAASLAEACGETPSLACRLALDATDSEVAAEAIDFFVARPMKVLLIVVVALVATRLARRVIRRFVRSFEQPGVRRTLGSIRDRTPNALLNTGPVQIRAVQRAETIAAVLRSAATSVIWVVAAMMILAEFDINLGPLIAGAGIAGVALGFGAQTLVRDFLSGMFMLMEDQFGVGDIVDLDQQTSGTVEAVSLRTTRLRAVDGTVWHVPNGDIRRVGNKSQHWSRALIDVEVAYDTDIERAQEVIGQVAHEIAESDRDVLEEPEVWGVEALGASGVMIRLVVKTRPSEQYRVSRVLRQRLKEAFDREGIEIPFPQQTVWHRPAVNREDSPAASDA
jgi:moderate conductance mechanosensitive channel